MPNLYVTKRKNGSFAGKVGGNRRASILATTQKAAIEEMRRMHPENPVLAQRVRYTEGKPGPDKFRRGG